MTLVAEEDHAMTSSVTQADMTMTLFAEEYNAMASLVVSKDNATMMSWHCLLTQLMTSLRSS